MSLANLDAQDLGAVLRGGIINEDVMQQISDISNIPLPFTDMIGSGTSKNQLKGWTQDALSDVDTDNAAVDGADATGNDAKTGKRVGNRHQIVTKVLQVSTRARSVDTIGFADTLAYQVMMRQREAQRDLEAISLFNQASVVDDGDTVPGRLGGLPSWLETNTSRGALGADGGYDTATGLTVAATAGTGRGLTETLVRDISQAVWVEGGNPSVAMSTPDVIRGLSLYMFDSSARIATLRRDANNEAPAQAIGSVNMFLTDFGVTLALVPNRLQQLNTLLNDLFFLDTELLSHSWLHRWRTDPLGKPGLSDKRQISGDATLVVRNEAGLGVIADIDEGIAVIT
jgi:hypothetical protein